MNGKERPGISTSKPPTEKLLLVQPGITHLHPKIILNSMDMLRSIPPRWNDVLLTARRLLLRKGIFMEAGSLPGFKDLSKENPGPLVGEKIESDPYAELILKNLFSSWHMKG